MRATTNVYERCNNSNNIYLHIFAYNILVIEFWLAMPIFLFSYLYCFKFQLGLYIWNSILFYITHIRYISFLPLTESFSSIARSCPTILLLTYLSSTWFISSYSEYLLRAVCIRWQDLHTCFYLENEGHNIIWHCIDLRHGIVFGFNTTLSYFYIPSVICISNTLQFPVWIISTLYISYF